jgi:hypothetical protein
MRQEDATPDIEPTPLKSLLALLAKLAPLDEDFPPIPDAAPDPVELGGEFSQFRRSHEAGLRPTR